MGNACVTSKGAEAQSAAAGAAPAAGEVVTTPRGLAESQEAQSSITPRQVQMQSSPSKSKSSMTQGGWVTEDAPSRSRTVELLDEQMAVKSQIEKSGRSIARRSSRDMENGTPEQALQDLLDGNARFMCGESDHPHQNFQRLQKVAPKQKPIAAILACADSRVPVELLFDQGFGDVFVCRIAGNIATAEEIASLEYAVLELNVKVIMVMGHTSCGAVKAALSGKAFPGFIDALVDHLDVAVVRAQSRNASSYSDLMAARHSTAPPDAAMLDMVIKENAVYQVARCKRSTIILQAVKEGKLIVVPSVYDIKTGEVVMLGR